jgi:hypothetical protein
LDADIKTVGILCKGVGWMRIDVLLQRKYEVSGDHEQIKVRVAMVLSDDNEDKELKAIWNQMEDTSTSAELLRLMADMIEKDAGKI